ncbi:hypothetical protein LSAT2_024281 [Lamellibrachia satsuma]|nr:hypothetical protein LSAT2_024281 [Lamellibrachia satsuma]
MVLLSACYTTWTEILDYQGFTLDIGVKTEQLDITVGAPTEFMNKTQGLMGVFNNDAGQWRGSTECKRVKERSIFMKRFSTSDSKGGVAPTAIVTVNLCDYWTRRLSLQ